MVLCGRKEMDAWPPLAGDVSCLGPRSGRLQPARPPNLASGRWFGLWCQPGRQSKAFSLQPTSSSLPPSWPRRHLGWRYVLAENHLSFACSLCLAPRVPKSLAVWLLKQLLPGQRAHHHPNPPTMGTVLSFSPRLVIHHLILILVSLFTPSEFSLPRFPK